MNPRKSNVLVYLEKQQDEYIPGLVVPEKYQMLPMRGTVLEIGPKVQDVLPGDKIIFNERAGTHVSAGDKKCLLVKEDAILAKVEE